MPRLPTMRVIGSHAMSTMRPASGLTGSRVAAMSVPPAWVVACRQLRLVVPPLRFLVDGRVGHRAQAPHRLAVEADHARGHAAAGWRVHERHELVREAGHRAADADAAHVRASADAGHPASLGDVAVDHGSPAADLHEALGRVVVVGEVALLVVPGAVAALVDGLAEDPG